jgi:hypothetical protein
MCSNQSSDFLHQLYYHCKNTLRDPTKYIYLESVRRDLSNVEIYKISSNLRILEVVNFS